jgi:predicted ATPase
LSRVWSGTIVEENTLQFQISTLRKALGLDRGFIRTIAGRGYRFVAEVTGADGEDATSSDPTASIGRRHDLGHDLPPPTNVPAPMSDLVGREARLLDVADLVAAHRLVTLVGIGGVGKTRLGLELGRRLLPKFADGVWLVELGPLSGSEFVLPTIASVLGLAEAGSATPERLAEALAPKDLLLLLDNCEHVIDAAAQMAEALLRATPTMRVIATSREPLRVEGEWIYPIPPLAVPPEASPDSEDLLQYGAVRLFVERARAADPDFSPGERAVAVIAAICRRLDGIPLAIELAAPRVAALGIEELAARLNDRFDLLTRGSRTALPRQRTLRATLDWSYDLLSEVERLVLRRLSVFAGGFTLDAASTVAASVEITPSGVVDCIGNLVEKSLVAADVVGPAARCRLLETTRAYATEKLSESGEFNPVARRHAGFYRDLFERAETEWERRSTAEMLDIYARDIDNLRAALNWAFSPTGDSSVGVALTIAVVPLWFTLSLMDECRGLVERALSSLAPGADARHEMELRRALGWTLINAKGGEAEAREVWADTLALAESVGDQEYQLRALRGLWAYDINIRRCRTALAFAQRFYDLASNKGEPGGLAVGDRLVGVSLHYTGDQINARRHLERALARSVATGQRSPMVRGRRDLLLGAHVVLGPVLWLLGFPDQAQHIAQRNLEVVLAGEDEILICYALSEAAGRVALFVGEIATAERYLAMLRDHSAMLRDHASRHGLSSYYNISGDWIHGALLLKHGDFVAGLQLLRTAFDELSEAGLIGLLMPFLGPMAEGLGAAGQIVQGLSAIDMALEQCERTGERWYLAELVRIKGGLLLREGAAGAAAAAEDLYRQGLDWARRQGALSWELRCATSLARLWQEQQRTKEARELFSPVYDRFTEGFETADLRSAKTLLDTLR